MDCIELTDSDSDYCDYYPKLYEGTSGEEDPDLSSPDDEVCQRTLNPPFISLFSTL